MAVVERVEAFSKAMKAAEAATAAASAILATSTTVQGAFAAAATASATAETVRAAAKRAGMTVDAAGNLMTAAGTAATTAETVAVLASSGALSAKTVIAGVLTGKIGLVTAAQWLWNAAMTANPIGLVIAGVTALAAGLAGLVVWLNRDTEEQKELKRSTDELADANDGLLDSMGSSRKAYEDNSKGIEANAAASEKLADKVYELAAAENKSEEDKRKLAILVDQLNESMPELNLQYDMQADALNKTEAETRKLIDAKKDEIRYQAASERAVEIAKEQMKTEQHLAETTKKRIELEERKAAGMDKTLFGGFKLQDQLEELIAQEADLNAKIEDQEISLNAVTETMLETERAARSLGEAQEEMALHIKSAQEIQDELVAAAKAREAEYTEYLQEQANKRGYTVDELTEYLGKDFVKRMGYIDEEVQHYLDVRDAQNLIAGERKAVEDDYTSYLMEQANARGMLLEEYTALLGENAIRNKLIVDDELNHAIDARIQQEAILAERAAAEEAHTQVMVEQANMRKMTVAELEQLQKDAAAQVEEANKRILSAYETMTASLGNVNREIKLDSETTWSSVQKNQQDMIAKTEEFSSLYAQLIKAGVSESYLDAIGATGPESIPLLKSMIKAGTDEVKSKEAEWKEAYGTIQDGLAGALSDDSETKKAIKDYISGSSGIGPSLRSELEAALKAADFAGLSESIPEGVGKGITDNMVAATDEAKRMGEESGLSFKEAIRSNSPSELFAQIAESIPQGAAKGIERVWNVVEGALTKLINQSKALAQSAVAGANFPAIGNSIVQGIIQGVDSMASTLQAKITSLANMAAQAARSALQIASPSGVFKKIGVQTGQGYIEGVEAMREKARRASEELIALPDIAPIASQAAHGMQAVGMAASLNAETTGAGTGIHAQSAQGAITGSENPITIIVKTILDGYEVGYAVTDYISQQQGNDLDNALRAAGVLA